MIERTILGHDGLRHRVRVAEPMGTETGCGYYIGGAVAHDATPEAVTCLGCLAWDPDEEERKLQELRDRYSEGQRAVVSKAFLRQAFGIELPEEDDDELP